MGESTKHPIVILFDKVRRGSRLLSGFCVLLAVRLRAIFVSTLRARRFLTWPRVSIAGVLFLFIYSSAAWESQLIVGPFRGGPGVTDDVADSFSVILRSKLDAIANNRRAATYWSRSVTEALIINESELEELAFFDYTQVLDPKIPIVDLPLRSLKVLWGLGDKRFTGLITHSGTEYTVEIATGSAFLEPDVSETLDDLAEFAAWNVLEQVAPLQLALHLRSRAPARSLNALRSVPTTHDDYLPAQALIAFGDLATDNLQTRTERETALKEVLDANNVTGRLVYATHLINTGRSNCGIEQLEYLAESFSDDARPHYLMIELRVAQGDIDAAKLSARRAASITGNEMIATYRLAHSILRHDAPASALEFIESEIAENDVKSNVGLLVTRGSARLQSSDLVGGQLDFKAALEVSRADDAEVFQRWGRVLRVIQGCESALPKWEQAESLGFLSQHLANSMGACYLELGNLQAAERLFRLAVQIDPKYAWGWGNLGILYRKQGDPRKAIEHFRASAETGVIYPSLFRGWAAALFDLRDFEGTVDLLQEVEIDTLNDETLVMYAFAQARTAQHEVAENILAEIDSSGVEDGTLKQIYEAMQNHGTTTALEAYVTPTSIILTVPISPPSSPLELMDNN